MAGNLANGDRGASKFRRANEGVSMGVKRLCTDTKSAILNAWTKVKETGKHEEYNAYPSSMCRFIDTPLSFFDDYQVISGMPVFALRASDQVDTELSQDGDAFIGGSEPEHQPQGGGSTNTKANKTDVTSSSFSLDGSRLLTGHKSGAVCVWDTEHGKLLKTLKSPGACEVLACHFIGQSNSMVASIDKSCHLVRWDLDNELSAKFPIPEEGPAAGVSSELWRVAFSQDGGLLAITFNTPVTLCPLQSPQDSCSRTTSAHPSRRDLLHRAQEALQMTLLSVYNVNESGNGNVLQCEARLKVAWSSSASNTLNGIRFSDSGKGLLVGLYSLTGRQPGTVVVWPNWRKPDQSISLCGSIASWSQDGNRVVAWDPFIRRGGHGRRSKQGACYVWNVGTAVSKIESWESLSGGEGRTEGTGICIKDRIRGHAELSPKYEARTPEFESSHCVLWARFVESSAGSCNLAMCTVQEEIDVQIWDVEEETLIHTLHTGIKRSEVPNDWFSSFAMGTGMEKMARSPDLCWIGVYIEDLNKGFIWNAVKGVRFLNISLPAEHMGQDYKLSFGGAGCKMAMVGSSGTLVWDTGAICGMGKGTGRQMQHYVLPKEMACGHLVQTQSSMVRRDAWDSHPIMDLKFSMAGYKLGMIRKGSVHMHVLDCQYQGLLHLSQDTKGASPFRSFSFSRDGLSLAAAMADTSVLLWELNVLPVNQYPDAGIPPVHSAAGMCCVMSSISSVSECVCPIAELGRLRAEESVLNMVFSVDGSGRETLVMCSGSGALIWLNVEKREEIERKNFLGHTECSGCRFKADGSLAALLTEASVAIVVDIVNRTEQQRIAFSCPLHTALVFPQNVASDASLGMAGWASATGAPAVCCPSESPDSANVDNVSRQMVILNDCTWLASERVGGWVATSKGTGQHVLAADSKTRVAVMPLLTCGHTKEVESGRNLNPEALALSGDGRLIACAGANEIIVWTPYATKGCVPDYYCLNADGVLHDKEAVEGMLREHGPSLMNRMDTKGWPLLLNAVGHGNDTLLHALLNYSIDTKTGTLFSAEHCESGNVSRESPISALELALEGRFPEIAGMLIRAMHEDPTSRALLVNVVHANLVRLAKQYPSLFLDAIKGQGMPVTIGAMSVPERVFKDVGFAVKTSSKFLDHEFWKKSFPVLDKSEVKRSALARVFPYPHCCRLGMGGLLRPMLVSRDIPPEAFSTQLVRSVIDYKWREYALKMVVKEACFYFVYVFFFTAFATVLGHDTEHQSMAGQTAEVNPFGDRNWKLQIALLSASAILGLMDLTKEVKQIVNDVRDGHRHGFNGLAYWLTSKWNLLELLSSLMTALILPCTHFTVDSVARDERESMMVAVTAIVLWWKLLYFATPFKATGPLVVMIFEVFRGIVFFVVLLGAIMFGFSLAFFVTFRHDLDDPSALSEGHDGDSMMNAFTGNCTINGSLICRDNDVARAFGGYERSLFTTFAMMLGEFDKEVFFIESSKGAFPRLLFVAYMATMMIMMLNLLIALMGFSFQRVKETEETTFLRARAAVIDDMESTTSARTKAHIESGIEEFLHTIVPRDAANGRKPRHMSNIEQSISHYRQELKEDMAAMMGGQRMCIERLEKEIKELRAAIGERLIPVLDVPAEEAPTRSPSS